jgi:hypothetical protein
MKRTPIIRDAPDGFTLDNHGAPIYAYLPPPTLRRHGRIRRAAVYIGAALVALMLLALLWLAATVQPAQGAVDHPGRATWTCRYRLVAIDPPRHVLVCKRVAR